MARQKRSATTTTALSSLTTCKTPRRPFAGRFVHARELAAEYRTGSNCRIDHSRYLRIDGEFGRAVDLEWRIQASDPFADQLELIGRPDSRLLVEVDLRGVSGERAIVEAASGRFVRDFAVCCLTFRGRNVPAVRRGGDQSFARAGAGLQQHLP